MFHLLSVLRFQGGYGDSDTAFENQYFFKWSSQCPCTVMSLSNSHPVLFVNPSYLKASPSRDESPIAYIPLGSTSGLVSVTFGDSGYPATAVMTSGKTFTYSGCKDLEMTASEWAPPSDCSCGKMLDVVLGMNVFIYLSHLLKSSIVLLLST